jgi:hypothetical protein
MVFVMGNPQSEGGAMPTEAELREMGKFNEDLVNAGVMLAGEGLHPTSKGKKVRFDGRKRTVVDGPFAEAKEIVAGYWLWQVKNMDEALEWIKRSPFQEGEVELRPVFETEDFAASDPTGEIRAQEHRMREQTEAKAKK